MFPDLHALVPFISLGLLGSLHCVGMCGGFVLMASDRSSSLPRSLVHQGTYVAGKALTYAALGLIIASTTQYLSLATDASSQAIDLRHALAWLAGGMLVLLGVTNLGLWQPSARLRKLSVRWNQFLLRSVAKLGPTTRAFALGAMTGCLPCGLSWGAIALALNNRPLEAGLGLLLFGLMTGIPLLGLGLGVHLLPQRVRRLGAHVLGPALIVFGLLTLLRAEPFAGATCCSDAPATSANASH